MVSPSIIWALATCLWCRSGLRYTASDAVDSPLFWLQFTTAAQRLALYRDGEAS